MIKNLLMTAFVLVLSALAYGEEVAAPATETPAAVTENTAMAATQEPVATETVKLAEDQIPLAITTDKKTAEAGNPMTKALGSGAIVMILLATSYYYVRKYKVSNTINKSNMQIKVLTQHYLGPKKSLAIVHVAGESMLIGITDTNISMIKSLSLIDDEVPADMPKTFSESLKKTAGTAGTTGKTVEELDEEFSFAGVTDTVSKKIKSMRSFS